MRDMDLKILEELTRIAPDPEPETNVVNDTNNRRKKK